MPVLRVSLFEFFYFVKCVVTVTASGNSISTPDNRQKYHQSTVCVLCEFVMSQVDNYLEDNTTKVSVWWATVITN